MAARSTSAKPEAVVTAEQEAKRRKQSLAANEELLKIKHTLRQLESSLRIARRRRIFAQCSIVLGPILALIMYVLFFLDLFQWDQLRPFYLPGLVVVLVLLWNARRLYNNPGGPLEPDAGGVRRRQTELELDLELARKHDLRKFKVAHGLYDTTTRRLLYKEDAYADIERLREESRKYRNVNNFLQGVLIVGALGATGSSAIAAELQALRWVTFGIAVAVGLASGFMGYYKYKERSFYLQQTADAIEHEWEAFEVGVGRYKRADTAADALADFVEEVHRLKSEQRKRQQNLEQPPEVRSSGEA
ncbi:DUF4231 domain-containing protein [Actinosynnema sp. CS-041913]|uniref:DUF4231 domain-containing protein n=1 Tax=Actinosynnema sp. CS-041913 TaxID=3239917 RepID=UPI003D90EC9A